MLKGARGGGGTPPSPSITTILPLVAVLALLGAAVAGGCSRSGGVSGTVTLDGRAEAGVFIELFDRVPDGVAAPVASANTGSGGSFRFPLPPGTYHLTARKRPQGSTGAGMLFGSSAPVEVNGSFVELPPIGLSDTSGSGGGGAGSGGAPVKGRVTAEGKAAPGAWVYLYPEGVRRGPAFVGRARTAADGCFELRVPPGRYQLVARLREGGDERGTLEGGDRVAEPAAPLPVGPGGAATGTLALHPLDASLLPQRRWAQGEGSFTLMGKVEDESGAPVAGAYAFLYGDHRMVGKPLALSAPTGSDGVFALEVPRPGSWYLGARTRFGGPVEPGEKMGVYEVEGDRALALPAGERFLPRIVVKEVW